MIAARSYMTEFAKGPEMAKPSFDPTDFMKAFDPEAMRKMFDPKNMMAVFQKGSGGFDMSTLMETNKKQVEAMAEANKAAAETYRDLMAKQMAVFQEVIAPAQKMIAESSDPETVKTRTEAMNNAVAEGLAVMKTLAENTRKANEDAFAAFKSHVDTAMKK